MNNFSFLYEFTKSNENPLYIYSIFSSHVIFHWDLSYIFSIRNIYFIHLFFKKPDYDHKLIPIQKEQW